MQCADDIRVVIKPRVLNGGPNTCTCSQVCDRVQFFAAKQISQGFAVAKIDVTNGHFAGETGNVRMLNLRIVKIVEVIEDDNVMPGCEQFLNKMRADKPSAASDQDSHGSKLATDGK